MFTSNKINFFQSATATLVASQKCSVSPMTLRAFLPALVCECSRCSVQPLTANTSWVAKHFMNLAGDRDLQGTREEEDWCAEKRRNENGTCTLAFWRRGRGRWRLSISSRCFSFTQKRNANWNAHWRNTGRNLRDHVTFSQWVSAEDSFPKVSTSGHVSLY